MKEHSLPILAVIVVALIAMGCDDDSSNDPPEASLTLEPNLAWIYDNATTTENPEITFNATASRDPDGEISNYHYDFGEGNSTDLSDDTTKRTYTNGGYYTTELEVSDNDGEKDSVERPLIINYQYKRIGQILESAAGASSSNEHIFSVSEFHPYNGKVWVNVTVNIGTPSVNVTVYNTAGDVVKNEREENIQGSANITIDLSKQDFNDFKYGEWKVEVACENGNIQYDITIKMMYKR